MQEVKLKDWKPIKDIKYLNKQLSKLRKVTELGDTKNIIEWFATIDTLDKYRFYRRVTVIKHKLYRTEIDKKFIIFRKYKSEDMWIQESRTDQYVALADFKHMFMICGDDMIMDYMKDLCRQFEYKKGLDWSFIDSFNTDINLKGLMTI